MCGEFIGTGLLMFLGSAAVLSGVVTGDLVGLGQIAVALAVAVTLAIATTAPISGAHLNPAMTVSFSLWRRFPRTKVVPYIMAQMIGAGMGSGTSYFLYSGKIAAFEASKGIVRSSSDTAILTAKCFGEYFVAPVTLVQAFAGEAIGTAILAFCVFCLTHPRNDTTLNKVYIPPLIGAIVGALICAIAPLTQAGVRKRSCCVFSVPVLVQVMLQPFVIFFLYLTHC
jgi:glycerol uptake facilitator-like aquaporin